MNATVAIVTVCDDTTVRVDSSNYAARPAAIGAKLLVRLSSHLVCVLRANNVRCQ